MQGQHSTEKRNAVFTEAAEKQLQKIYEDIQHIMRRRAMVEASGRGGSLIEVTASDVNKAWEWLRGETERSAKSRFGIVQAGILLIVLGLGYGIASIILVLTHHDVGITLSIVPPVSLIVMGFYITFIFAIFNRDTPLRKEIRRLFRR